MRVPLQLLSTAEADFNPSQKEIEAIRERIRSETALELDESERRENRKRMLSLVAAEGVLDANERYIGNNDLLPINYLMLGHQHARAVGCIRYFDRVAGRPAVATGFLVSESLLLTNHHVFPFDDAAAFGRLTQDARIEFGHEYDVDGRMATPIAFDLDADAFFHAHEALDLALVAVRPKDRTGAHELRAQGYLVLNGTLGKAGVGDPATIVQHPNGREKQIALRKNEIINLDSPDFLVYVSDTAPGSSGAPVFNDQWQVIALHSAGVAKKNARGEYVDKDNNVIQPENERIDADRVVWVHNRGTRTSAIMRYLASPESSVADAQHVRTLFSPAYTDSRPYAFLSRPTADVVGESTGSDARERMAAVVHPIPPTLAPPVLIQITIGGQTQTLTGAAALPALGMDELALEKKYEDELDFRDCDGFDPDFLGVRIPMPSPQESLRKRLAFRVDSPSQYILDYHHVSTIHEAVRRVPVVSAINVHGKYRYESLTGRTDKWFRDNRLDYDVQLDDAFYKLSGFDKGHLSRREDAEWGRSKAAAERAANLTCGYTNAVPQVPTLNRATYGYKGLWGQLEGKLLEQGVKGESGKASRICVFSGPIFTADDPVFKGVQVALSFYKIVAWYDATGTLRTTCFRLSQEKLVGEIEFEALRFDEVFKNRQVGLKEIEKATQLKFAKALHDAADAAGDGDFDESAFEKLVGKAR